MKYFIYVLSSEIARKSYVGMTDNLERRIQQHNSWQHAFTKRYMPWKMLYSEEYNSREAAHKRELYLKSAAGRRFLQKNIFRE